MAMRQARVLWLVLAAAACGGGGQSTPDVTATDVIEVQPSDPGAGETDAVVPDAAEPTDVAGDPAAEGTPEANDTAEAGELPWTCDLVAQGQLAPPTPNAAKLTMQVWHFNIQYVAGGLIGFSSDDPDGNFNLDDDQLQDLIVTQSLEPLLDILKLHPTWGVDIEMQGLMVDVLRLRHPAVLQKLSDLVAAGQVEVPSFHYSDQLFTAHSRWSMERSIELNKRAFAGACLPVAPAVFTQEGQFSEGMLELMKTQGQTVGIMKGGIYEYLYGTNPTVPLFSLRGQDVITTDGVNDGKVLTDWYFVGDGETKLTDNLDPYVGKLFKYSQKALEQYVKDMTQKESDGYWVTTVGQAVKQIKKLGYTPQPMPVALDCTWRPQDSDNLFAWMGRTGGLFGPIEADNEVLTRCERARRALEAALLVRQTLPDAAVAKVDADALQSQWENAILQLALAEVSDAEGWRPWKGEVDYGLNKAQAALDAATGILQQVRTASGKPFGRARLADGLVDYLDAKPVETPAATPEADGPIVVTALADDGGFDVKTAWELVPSLGAGVHRLTVTLTRTEPDYARFSLTFPRTEDVLIYSPAMLEDEVQTWPLSQFSAANLNIPAANGLLGLGNGVFLVKDLSTYHLSAFLPKAEPVVRFNDQTLFGPGPYTFVLYVATGMTAEQARALAWKINVKPAVDF